MALCSLTRVTMETPVVAATFHLPKWKPGKCTYGAFQQHPLGMPRLA